MERHQGLWGPDGDWSWPGGAPDKPDLVFLFGARNRLEDDALVGSVRKRWPEATLFGCSTAGDIAGTQVRDDGLVATAVRWQGARTAFAAAHIADKRDSRGSGTRLAGRLSVEGLRHVLLLSDGVHVNGSELVDGLRDALPDGVQVTGGLAGDGDRFEKTVVLTADGAEGDAVAALGLYGPGLHVGYGSLGGWDPFGPMRRITRAEENVLYELDGQPALALYKRYLGDQAKGLPATGLLFPLSVRPEGRPEIVRTILGVDEDSQSLTFAGHVPEGATARLMRANFDRLVDGASGAARTSHEALGSMEPELAILISCVGRKLVLKQRVEDELEAVRDVLGAGTTMAGFYSYGEVCPAAPTADCQLHNQTMTITTLREA